MDLKCMIVDDEPLAVEVIENYVKKVPGLETVAICHSAIEAFEVLRQMEVDLIFLDIEMPQLSGIEFLNIIENAPKVIFTTAHPNYALEGYEYDVVDYLLKPVPFGRFLKAVNKLHRLIGTYTPNIPEIEKTTVATNTSKTLSFIYVKEDKKMLKIYLKDILFIESVKDYVCITTTEKKIMTKQQISYLEEKLPQEIFIRVHRSYIIAVPRIDAFAAHFIEIQQKEIPIGRSYKPNVLKRLMKKGFRI